MADKTAFHNLSSGMVVDRSVLVTLDSATIATVIGNVRAAGASPGNKRLRVIDNAHDFFNASNMIKLIMAGDQDFKLVAEHAGIQLLNSDVLAIQQAEIAKATIEKAMTPKYAFAPVPAGWSFADDVSFGPTKVRRKRTNVEGDNTQFSLSPAALEKVWIKASNKWANGKVTPAVEVTSQGYRRSVDVYSSHVRIGCQTIRRYELEQIAKHKGWAFPAAA